MKTNLILNSLHFKYNYRALKKILFPRINIRFWSPYIWFVSTSFNFLYILLKWCMVAGKLLVGVYLLRILFFFYYLKSPSVYFRFPTLDFLLTVFLFTVTTTITNIWFKHAFDRFQIQIMKHNNFKLKLAAGNRCVIFGLEENKWNNARNFTAYFKVLFLRYFKMKIELQILPLINEK